MTVQYSIITSGVFKTDLFKTVTTLLEIYQSDK